ncbi:MAG: S41 family peptidase [Tidjanibacter sp.]|nr:S41 family peptidase [Tidjanibacter sp.]
MNSNKTALLAPIVIAVAVAVGILAGYRAAHNSQDATTVESSVKGRSTGNKLDATLQLIGSVYVDSVSPDSLVEELMPELMAHLDPHSVYIPASEMEEVNQPLEGEFDGIGVVFNMATDTVIVLNIIAGGPSYKAGILPGDRIITIDSDTVAGRKVPQNNVVERLRGKRGTKVTVGIERQNVDHLANIDIIRDKIPVNSIDAAFMIRPEVGYIKLTNFSRSTRDDFMKELSKLQTKGMSRLIFDLRGNSGGYLDQAIALADEFLPEGKLIVYTEDRNGKQTKEFSSGRGSSTEIPLVILIDEYSASSSEILAGAVQDNDRGLIIGRRSYGKGLVQTQIPFSDGSAIRLTIARYFTPTGRSIQKPYKLGEAGYEDDLYNRYLNNEFFSAEGIHFDDSLKYTTPAGKTVYGGGGIMPDIFVPLDTLEMTPYYYKVNGLNILYRYTIEYTDAHRRAINRITTLEELDKFFAADQRLLDDFVDYAARKGVTPNTKEIATSARLIRALLKGYIGRNTELQDAAYIYEIAPVDNSLSRAIEEIDKI